LLNRFRTINLIVCTDKPGLRISVRYEGYQYNKDECLCRFFVSNHSELW